MTKSQAWVAAGATLLCVALLAMFVLKPDIQRRDIIFAAAWLVGVLGLMFALFRYSRRRHV